MFLDPLGINKLWNNFIEPFLPKKHYFLGVLATGLKGLAGKIFGGGAKGLLGRAFGKTGVGLFGKTGGFMSGQGKLAGLMGRAQNIGKGSFLDPSDDGLFGQGKFRDAFKGFDYKGDLGAQGGGYGGEVPQDWQPQAFIQSPQLNPIPQLGRYAGEAGLRQMGGLGGQWAYNPGQSGMAGLKQMGGLLGRYAGGGGYRY
tara:strand:+ start:212 stop:808 length:597 start_codon:yes stop_codon:yes gene_type:complete